MNKKHCHLLPGLLAVLVFAVAPAQALTNNFSITTGPVLQSPTETSMTVMWITSTNATAVVEYGPINGELKTAFSSHHGLIDANERVHQIVLPDLQPGAAYRYRVISRRIINLLQSQMEPGDAVTNEFKQFQVFDRSKTNYSLVVFNDIHGQTKTISDMLKVAGEKAYDFVVFNGDVLSSIEKESHVEGILNQAATSFASTVPLFWVRGNHETRGSLARQLPSYIALPIGRYYYSFDHGPVHFVVLDSGEDKVDNHREYRGLVDFFRYRQEEGEWLKSEVQSEAFRRAKYRVVISHMPFASLKAAGRSPHSKNDPFSGMADAFENFGATLEGAGVDLMISGHLHKAGIVEAEAGRHSYPVVIGGGNLEENRTIIRVNVSDAELEAVILRSDNSTVGTCKMPAKR